MISNKPFDEIKKTKVKSLLNEEYEITEVELEVIKEVYDKLRNSPEPCIGARTLRKKYGKEVMEFISGQSTPNIKLQKINWDERYCLTLRGFYLCPEAKEDFQLICKYVSFLKEKFNHNPEIKEILSTDVETTLNLSKEQTSILGKLIDFIGFWGANASSGQDMWKYGVPLDIEDLDDAADPIKYLKNRLIEHEKREKDSNESVKMVPMPLLEEGFLKESEEQVKSLADLKKMLEFLKSGELRGIIENDLEELERVQKSKAFKAIIIFCGIIVEAILLDVLDRRSDIAKSYFRKNQNYWPCRASLEDMINVAESENLISETPARMAEILKTHRDLVHPYRMFKSHIVVDSDTAEAMVLLLKMIIRDLERAYKDGKIKTYEEK